MSKPKSRSFVNSIVSHYLKYDKDNPFIFISAVMAFLGVAAGVAVMLIALAITTGIQKDFKERLFVMNYPLTVFSYGGEVNNTLVKKIEETFPTVKTSPYYTTSAVVKNKIGIQGSLIYGVDFQKESAINNVFAQTDLNNSYDGVFRMLIGDALSAELDARESVFELHASGGLNAWRAQLRAWFPSYDELANGVQQFLEVELPPMDLTNLKNAPYERPR